MVDSPPSSDAAQQQAALEAQRKQALDAQKNQALAAAPKDTPADIMQMIYQLLEFLFGGSFQNGADAPNESAEDMQPGRGGQNVTFNHGHGGVEGSIAVAQQAAPAWAKLQQDYRAAHGGQNPAEVFTSALDGAVTVTSGFGERDNSKLPPGASRFHKGVDEDGGEKIQAAADGVVLFSGRAKGYGNLIILGHGDGSTTRYGHVKDQDMAEIGTKVARGQQIAWKGSEGISTAPHLHYEYRPDGINGDPVNPTYLGTKLAKGEHISPTTQYQYAEADVGDKSPNIHHGPQKPTPGASPPHA